MIQVSKVKDKAEGNLYAHDILKKIVDSKTLLALSGGTSPDYRTMIVDPADILPGATVIVDERWTKDVENTNLHAMKKSGLGKFFKKKKIDFYGIQQNANRDALTHGYDHLICDLFEKFPKKVGVMGVGTNLHTAGIFPNSEAAHSADYVVGETVDDKFPQRITLTLKSLGEFQHFIILAFGSAKQDPLRTLLDENENDMQKYPAIFYRKIPAKSYLITDQQL